MYKTMFKERIMINRGSIVINRKDNSKGRNVINRNDNVKDFIRNATKELINDGNGDINKITVRSIALKANVGVGLINYHFQTKDNLIALCIQEMINEVIEQFVPQLGEKASEVTRIVETMKQVADFLFLNPSISRISILSDMTRAHFMDNSEKTMLGLVKGLDHNKSEQENKNIAFALVAVLQDLFLRKDMNFLGFDSNVKEKRDEFLEYIIRLLLDGGKNNE